MVDSLGRFRVNAILSDSDFAMEEDLVERSGKSEAELKDSLFRNMSAIDFKGDGQSGEYGSGYISLAPVPPRINRFSSTPMTASSAGTASRSMAPTMSVVSVRG